MDKMAVYFQLESLVDELSYQLIQSRKRLTELDLHGPNFYELHDELLDEILDLTSQRKGALKAMKIVTEALGI